MPTDAALEAVQNLRQGSLFQWYVIPLLALVFYVYAVEVEKRNWSAGLAGLAFWVYDMKSVRKKVTTVGAIYAFDIVCLAVFGGVLGWI